MASIEKRSDGQWRVRWREHPGAPQHARHFARKVDAERWATEVEHSKMVGAYVDPRSGRVTFRDYAEAWRARQPWRESTAARTEVALRRHVYPVLGERPLASIRTSEIQAAVKGFRESLAPASVEGAYRVVAAVLRAAVTDRLIASSPAQGVKLPRLDRRQVVPLSVEQVDAIARAITPRLEALVRFAAGSGLRQGECFGLTIDRVDFLRRTVRVDRQMVQPSNGGEPAFGPPKTRASVRTVPLAAPVVTMLSAHVATFGTGPDGLLFVNRYGRPIRRSHFGSTWRRACDEAGVEARFHDLRHHFASVLIGAGCSIKAVQGALGHATASETLDTYSHLWPADEDRLRDAVARAWADPAEDSLRTGAGH